MSSLVHGAGSALFETDVTGRLSNVDVVSCDVSWLVTASPAPIIVVVEKTGTEVLPIGDHVDPSDETAASTCCPVRVSRSHTGAGADRPAMNVVLAPWLVRAMNSISPVGRTSRITFAADASNP